MSKLMEHRGCVVPRDEYRFAGLAFNKVGIVGNDGRDVAIQSFLRAIGIHPGPRALAGASARIEIPETDVFLRRLVGDFPNANVRMSYGDVRYGREVEIKEFARDPEDAL